VGRDRLWDGLFVVGDPPRFGDDGIQGLLYSILRIASVDGESLSGAGMMNASNRPWEWTPSASANASVATLLRLPLVHRLVSSRLLLLNFTGHKTGKRYSVPVGYVREGAKVTILTKHIRAWWRNFQGPAPVTVYLEGKIYQGTAIARTDEATIIPIITSVITQYPYYAQFYGVHLLPGGRPDREDIRCIAPKIVVVQIELADQG
jgi:hypothetical protein